MSKNLSSSRKRPEVSRGSLKARIEEIEKQEIISALRECRWVMAKAARKLGITERMIGYKIKKYRIRIGVVEEDMDSFNQPVPSALSSNMQGGDK